MEKAILILCLLLAGIGLFADRCAHASILTRSGCEHVIIDQDKVGVAWDPVEGATKYQFRVTWVDPKDQSNWVIVTQGETTSTTAQIYRTRVGHLILTVRAGNDTEWSEWATSTDPKFASCNGTASSWIIFWKLPTPIFE